MKKLVTKGLLFLGIVIFGLTFIVGPVFAVEGIVTGSSVRIRKESSKSSEEVSVASKGEKVNVIGEDGDWYKIEFEDVTGYISKDYVDTDYEGDSSLVSNSNDNTSSEETNNEDESNESSKTEENEENNSDLQKDNIDSSNSTNQSNISLGSVVKIENEVNIRNLPNFSSRLISNIAANTEVTVKEELNNWIKVTDGNVTGWLLKIAVFGTITEPENIDEQTPFSETTDTQVPSEQETVENETSVSTSNVGKKGVVNVDSAKIRTSPNGTVIDVVDLNDEVEILSEEDDWYKVNIGDNKGCYIAKRLVTVK